MLAKLPEKLHNPQLNFFFQQEVWVQPPYPLFKDISK